MEKDTEYEILVKEIYEGLLKNDGVTIDVRHNVKIKGKGATHQIDVYWEYKIAGVLHKVAIECKNYNKPISKGLVTSFQGVLEDIGNINGIMVSRAGFQKGAIEYAKFWGINLREIRAPKETDWDGRIKYLDTTIQIIEPSIKAIKVAVDEAWVVANVKVPINEGFKYNMSGYNEEMWVIDKDGNKIKNFLQLQDELPISATINNPVQDLSHIYEFEDEYMEFENLGRIKIKCIKFVYDVSISSNTFTHDVTASVNAILKDAITGDLKFIRNKGV